MPRGSAPPWGIAHQVLDLSEDFRRHVVDAFAQEYLAGRTPNPCVVCNRTVKFGGMLDYALEQGMDCVATGHYATRPMIRRPGVGSSIVAVGKGSELCPIWSVPAAACPYPLSSVGDGKGAGAGAGKGGGTAGGGQRGQYGDMLRPQGRSARLPIES